MARLHHLLEQFDEYEREARGFFLVEQDRAGRDAPPVLIYISPASVSGAKGPERRPPDWIGEVLLSAGAPSRLERYARAGVGEYWRVVADAGLPGGIAFEVCTDPDPGAGTYRTVRAVGPAELVRSPVWAGLQLRPQDLLAQGRE